MSKTKRIIYWIATLWLSLGMFATGIAQLLKKNGQGGLDMIRHLGYPDYLIIILGVWKILGVIVILIPGFSLMKEWAYAGFLFIMTGAIFSHLAVNDPLVEIFPALLLLILSVISWYLRPESRKLFSLRQSKIYEEKSYATTN